MAQDAAKADWLSDEAIDAKLMDLYGVSPADRQWLRPWSLLYSAAGIPLMLIGFYLLITFAGAESTIASLVLSLLLAILGLEMAAFGLAAALIVFLPDTRVKILEHIVGLLIDTFKPGGRAKGVEAYPFIHKELQRYLNAQQKDARYTPPSYFNFLYQAVAQAEAAKESPVAQEMAAPAAITPLPTQPSAESTAPVRAASQLF